MRGVIESMRCSIKNSVGKVRFAKTDVENAPQVVASGAEKAHAGVAGEEQTVLRQLWERII